MRLSDVKSLLAGHLAGRPTRANFRTGTLTVCTMVPMRSVPHRVVCLVGLDDGVFPRLDTMDGDDVLARRPMTGERDIRSEDRQLLLDAIGAATEKLVITYTGADPYTGHHRPPAVPLVELLDAFDQTTTQPVRKDILVEHPLQPFDRKNVTPGALVPNHPFTFDPTARTAALAAVGERVPPPKLFGRPLPEPPRDDVALADLHAVLQRSGKGLLPRARLHAAVRRRHHRGCDARRDRPARAVDRRRPDAARHAARHASRHRRQQPSGGAAPCRRDGSVCARYAKSGTVHANSRLPHCNTSRWNPKASTSTLISATDADSRAPSLRSSPSGPCR